MKTKLIIALLMSLSPAFVFAGGEPLPPQTMCDGKLGLQTFLEKEKKSCENERMEERKKVPGKTDKQKVDAKYKKKCEDKVKKAETTFRESAEYKECLQTGFQPN